MTAAVKLLLAGRHLGRVVESTSAALGIPSCASQAGGFEVVQSSGELLERWSAGTAGSGRVAGTGLFTSLDGIVDADDDWQFAYFDEELIGGYSAASAAPMTCSWAGSPIRAMRACGPEGTVALDVRTMVCHTAVRSFHEG